MFERYTALASPLRIHGRRFFANEKTLWDDVADLRAARNKQHEIEEISRIAELAFKQDDWGRTIELLEKLDDYRTILQTARLAFARKRLGE